MTTTETTIDWPAAAGIAERLGVHTRRLVAERNVETTRDWCLRMARENTGEGTALRSISYYELAVLLGHRGPTVDDLAGRDWSDLLLATQELSASVRTKAAEEAARAKAEAEAKAAEAEAAKELAGDSTEDNDPDRHSSGEEDEAA
jgi:hypothetical protein